MMRDVLDQNRVGVNAMLEHQRAFDFIGKGVIQEPSSPTCTVAAGLLSVMVGDLRMWLYRAHPGNPRRCAGADHCS